MDDRSSYLRKVIYHVQWTMNLSTFTLHLQKLIVQYGRNKYVLVICVCTVLGIEQLTAMECQQSSFH